MIAVSLADKSLSIPMAALHDMEEERFLVRIQQKLIGLQLMFQDIWQKMLLHQKLQTNV